MLLRCVAALFVVAGALRMEGYAAFCTKFGRRHLDEEDYRMRRELFERRRASVKELNRGTLSWTAEVNEFADYTPQEFAALLGHRTQQRPGESFLQLRSEGHVGFFAQMLRIKYRSDVLHGLPNAVDWRSLNASAFEKVQGDGCGSCWAMAAASALEMHAEIHGQSPRELSVDQLLECVENPRRCGGTGGCGGASAELAFQFVTQHGIRAKSSTGGCTEAPYLRLQGFGHLRSNQLRSLLEAVTQGPVVVGVDATRWDLYGSGIFDACEPDAIINHAVVLVGYGQDAWGLPFWRIRNSWGQDWGEEGYMRLLRHGSDRGLAGHCGTDRKPQEGVWCAGERQQVPVCGMCGILSDATYPQQVVLQ